MFFRYRVLRCASGIAPWIDRASPLHSILQFVGLRILLTPKEQRIPMEVVEGSLPPEEREALQASPFEGSYWTSEEIGTGYRDGSPTLKKRSL